MSEDLATKLQTIAKNMPDVYSTGYNKGFNDGKAEGSGDNWYDTFWDTFQYKKGQPQSYRQAFCTLWNDKSFTPKYNIVPTDAHTMFGSFKTITGGENMDLVKHLENLGVSLDFSQCTVVTGCFNYAKFSRVGEINLAKVVQVSTMFGNCTALETIDKIVSHENLVFHATTFQNDTNLKNITFEGVIATSISFANSPLLTTGAEGETTNSVQSIIDHLMTITDGVARTLTFHEDVKANLTDEQIIRITASVENGGKGWTLA